MGEFAERPERPPAWVIAAALMARPGWGRVMSAGVGCYDQDVPFQCTIRVLE